MYQKEPTKEVKNGKPVFRVRKLAEMETHKMTEEELAVWKAERKKQLQAQLDELRISNRNAELALEQEIADIDAL